jgi:hypothetical protein
MIQQIPGGGIPQGPKAPSPQSSPAPTPLQPSSGGGSNQAETLSAWGQMFGGMASEKQLKQIINYVIKQAIDQIKHDQQKAIEAIKKMRKTYEDS